MSSFCRIFLLGILLGCFICQNTFARKLVLLNNASVSIEPDFSYTVEDSSTKMNIEDILTPYWQNQFTTNDKNLNFNVHATSSYWKKIELLNLIEAQNWMLEFSDPHIEQLEVYFVTEGGEVKAFEKTGFKSDFRTRTIAHKNYVYPFYLAKGEHLTVYARFGASAWFSSIKPNVRSVADFSQYFLTEYHLLGLYYGIILILVVYNFILGFFVHEKVHFFYCAYIISCGLYTYAEDGLAIQWLWPHHPQLNIFLLQSAPILLLTSFVLYSDRFIDLGHYYPRARKYIWGSSLLFILSYLIFWEYHREIGLFYLIPYVITCYAAFKAYQFGYQPARFFLIGNSMIILSFVVYYIRINGWIPSNVVTVYMFNYAFVCEAIVLSIALADKVKTTKLLSERAQKETIRQLRINEELHQKVNRELEGKVQERTKELVGKTEELTQANQHLEALKHKLYEMNSKMDISIWELKKEVKKETEARILNNTVSYEEFQSIFPDKKCYEYLKDLKWKEGFLCPKCGNNKYGKGNNLYTYKCTQCQHQESVTSHTLFHALKFPISKAFYLSYFLTRNMGKLSYEEIGALLDLNKNTVWNFDKKLKEGSKGKGRNGAIPEWEKVLLAKS